MRSKNPITIPDRIQVHDTKMFQTVYRRFYIQYLGFRYGLRLSSSISIGIIGSINNLSSISIISADYSWSSSLHRHPKVFHTLVCCVPQPRIHYEHAERILVLQ